MSLETSRRAWLLGAASVALAEEPAAPLRLPRKVRVGLIGLDGHYGEITSHLGEAPEIELVALAGAAPPPKWNARHYTDYREMLDREQLDVAAVLNANGDHAAAILACADRKIHVIAEKPLATELADLERIERAVARSGIRLTMLLNMRFDPPYLALRRAVEAGQIGEVAQIAAQKSYKLGARAPWYFHRKSYGGTIPWVGIHMVDLMRWTSGREFREAVSYQGRVGFAEIGEMENVTGTLFRLDNGGIGHLQADYLRPDSAPAWGDDRLRLAGTQGVIEYQAATGVVLITRAGGRQEIRDLPPKQSLFLDFLRSVYLGAQPLLPLEDIYRVNRIVLLARDSADLHHYSKL
jgi:predicted dehydrogenase